MLNTLRSQKAFIAENINREEERTGSERERLRALVRGLGAEISELQGQIELQTERLKVVGSDFDAADQLKSKGFMSAVDFRRREIQVLEHKQAISALNQQLAARKNQLTETQFSLQQLPTVMAQKVQALRNDLAYVEQRIAQVTIRRAYVIRAPTNGRISTLQATVGQNADPQRLQLEIIPEESVLQAVLFLPARAIGFVKPGQAVRILYEAFPYQHFGTYHGNVVKVSQTILTSSDATGPIKLNEPAYRVTVALERPDIDAYGKRVALQPDMLLKADVILEKRSLMSWLTNPLRGVRMYMSLLNFTARGHLPLIRQAEAAECGLACLAMVASYHGHRIDLNTLRRRYPPSLNGVSLRALIQLASHLHLLARPLRYELQHLRQLRLPAILHWDMNHFLVLKAVTRKGDCRA